MNKDEIKKALRCCKGECCSYCPRWCEKGCQSRTLSDALDLITEQEKEIEKQNSRVKVLKNRLNEKYALISNMERKIDALKDNFESLQKDYEFIRDCDAEHCLEIEETVKQAKIDMLNELKQVIHDDIFDQLCPDCAKAGASVLEQIDDMIEELKK